MLLAIVAESTEELTLSPRSMNLMATSLQQACYQLLRHHICSHCMHSRDYPRPKVKMRRVHLFGQKPKMSPGSKRCKGTKKPEASGGSLFCSLILKEINESKSTTADPLYLQIDPFRELLRKSKVSMASLLCAWRTQCGDWISALSFSNMQTWGLTSVLQLY